MAALSASAACRAVWTLCVGFQVPSSATAGFPKRWPHLSQAKLQGGGGDGGRLAAPPARWACLPLPTLLRLPQCLVGVLLPMTALLLLVAAGEGPGAHPRPSCPPSGTPPPHLHSESPTAGEQVGAGGNGVRAGRAASMRGHEEPAAWGHVLALGTECFWAPASFTGTATHTAGCGRSRRRPLPLVGTASHLPQLPDSLGCPT